LIDNENNNCENVAKLFNNSPRTISNWVHKVNETNNIEVLKYKKIAGRKTRLNKEQLNIIKKSLAKPPSEFGLNAKVWSGKLLSHFITLI